MVPVRWAVNNLWIVPLHNLVLGISVPILVLKPRVDLILNVQFPIKRLNVHVCLDFCPTLQLLLDVLVPLQLVLQIINVPKDSNAMPNFADLYVIQMKLVWLMNCVLTIFAKKFANPILIVKQLKFARVLNVYPAVVPAQIVRYHKCVIITSVLILAQSPSVELMPIVSYKITNHSAAVHQVRN